MSILAFDYGERRIGVAAGQTVSSTATPLKTLVARKNGPDWEAISALIKAWEPDALVVGLPINMDGTEHALAPAVERFTRQLRGRFGRPVYTVDERLTSWEARGRLGGAEREGLDAVAAQVILETWLAQRQRESSGRL